MINTTAVEKAGLQPGAMAGKNVVISGGSSGIGREMVSLFSQLGASVVAVDIVEPHPLFSAGDIHFIRCDLSSSEDIARLREEAVKLLGRIDILINSAAVSPVSPLLQTEEELWDKVMAVNLRGTFLMCKSFLPEMLNDNSGLIINMVSAEAMPYMSAYIASKQGLVGFSKSLAGEVGDKGVKVIAFGPGFVDTPGLRSAMQELARLEGLDAKQAMEGATSVEEAAVAAACLILFSADEYHGEMVDGYSILDKVMGGNVGSFTSEPGKQPGEGGEGLNPLEKASELIIELQDIISRTEAEFGKLPVFVRPMAKGGFKKKSGQTIPEWRRTAESLAITLQDIKDGNYRSHEALQESFPSLEKKFTMLIDYCRSVPAETARFTKDPAFLQEITATMARREEVICALITTLTNLIEGDMGG